MQEESFKKEAFPMKEKLIVNSEYMFILSRLGEENLLETFF